MRITLLSLMHSMRNPPNEHFDISTRGHHFRTPFQGGGQRVPYSFVPLCLILPICPSRSTLLLSLPGSVLPGADFNGSISWAPLLSGKGRYQIRVFILSASSLVGQELAMAAPSTKDFSSWCVFLTYTCRLSWGSSG